MSDTRPVMRDMSPASVERHARQGRPGAWTTPRSISPNVWWHIEHNRSPVEIISDQDEPLAVLVPWAEYERLMRAATPA